MAKAKSGDTLKIAAGQYYFGEGLTVPEGVKIESVGEEDAFIIIPHMYEFDWGESDYVGDDISYEENKTVISQSTTHSYGFEIYSNAFTDLKEIESVNVAIKCSCTVVSGDSCSGKILAGDHILLAGGLMVSHDSPTCNNLAVTISFGENPVYSFSYEYKCIFAE